VIERGLHLLVDALLLVDRGLGEALGALLDLLEVAVELPVPTEAVLVLVDLLEVPAEERAHLVAVGALVRVRPDPAHALEILLLDAVEVRGAVGFHRLALVLLPDEPAANGDGDDQDDKAPKTLHAG
jgi:hypothetical protein